MFPNSVERKRKIVGGGTICYLECRGVLMSQVKWRRNVTVNSLKKNKSKNKGKINKWIKCSWWRWSDLVIFRVLTECSIKPFVCFLSYYYHYWYFYYLLMEQSYAILELFLVPCWKCKKWDNWDRFTFTVCFVLFWFFFCNPIKSHNFKILGVSFKALSCME